MAIADGGMVGPMVEGVGWRCKVRHHNQQSGKKKKSARVGLCHHCFFAESRASLEFESEIEEC